MPVVENAGENLEFPQNAIKTRMTFPKVPICLIFEKS